MRTRELMLVVTAATSLGLLWPHLVGAAGEFSTYVNRIGPLASELNVASNGNWSWGPEVSRSGAERYVVSVRAPFASNRDNYYWSSVFKWSSHGSGGGGYIGLQTGLIPMPGRPRGGIFSIWDVKVAEAVDGGIAQPFGGEGIGMQTARTLNWEWDTEFELIVEKDQSRSGSQFNWWRGFIVGKSSGRGIEVGRIKAPAAWGHPIPHNTFLERYGLPNTCGQFEQAGGVFSDVRAYVNGEAYQPAGVSVELREYDDCGAVVTASGVAGGYSVTINRGTPR